MALTFDQQKWGGVRSTLLLSEIKECLKHLKDFMYSASTIRRCKNRFLIGSPTLLRIQKLTLFCSSHKLCNMWMPLWIKHQSTVTPQAATNSATGAPVRYFQFSKNEQRNGEPFSAASQSKMRSGSQTRSWPEMTAAARRNCWKLCPGSPEMTGNHQKSELFTA